MAKRPHILIYEPEATGHQMEYLRHLLTGIQQNVTHVAITLLTTAEAADHPNARRLVQDFSGLVTLRMAPATTKVNPFFRAISAFYERQWQQAESLAGALDEIGAANIDFLILPHLESIGLLQLGLRRNAFRGIPWATIAISVRFHHRASGIQGPTSIVDVLQGLFFRKVLRDPALACFGTIDPYLAQSDRFPNVAHCPDPCAIPALTSRQDARAAYGIPHDACVVVVFGFIDHRKCIDTLLQGAALVSPDLKITVLLAGPQHSRDLAQALSSQAARTLRDRGALIEVNRFILSGQDIDPISAADISWVFYERNFVASSSVVVRSGLSRRPMIVRRQGVVGRQVEDHQFGLAVPTDDPDTIADALTRLAKDPDLRRQMGENGARAFAQNTPENFSRPIVDAINRTLETRDSRDQPKPRGLTPARSHVTSE